MQIYKFTQTDLRKKPRVQTGKLCLTSHLDGSDACTGLRMAGLMYFIDNIQNYDFCRLIILQIVGRFLPTTFGRKVHVYLVAQLCPTLSTPWTVAHPAPLIMEFSSPVLQVVSLLSDIPWSCPNHWASLMQRT